MTTSMTHRVIFSTSQSVPNAAISLFRPSDDAPALMIAGYDGAQEWPRTIPFTAGLPLVRGIINAGDQWSEP